MSGVGLFDGFKHYLAPDDEDSIRALQTALIVLDTNVLLSLYKYNDETRTEYLAALAKVGDRLWVPHQVALEFWRSRRSVLVTIRQNHTGILSALKSTQRQAHENVSRWARASATNCADLDEAIDRLFGEIDTRIREHSSTLVNPARPTGDDPVLTQLEGLLGSKVEQAPDPQTRAEWVAEGRRRVAAQIPPGYLDAPKEGREAPDGATGDYLVWRSAMDEATRRNLDLLIITGDIKEDWWVQQDGHPLAPRPELAEEFREISGGRGLYLLQPLKFLKLSERGLGVAVSMAAMQNVEQVAEQEELPETAGEDPWTVEGVHEMLRRLDARGDFQANVIRRGARWGWVGRDSIFRLAGRDLETGSLNGITRPVTRIQKSLIEDGVISASTEPMFTLHYEGGALSRIYIPHSVVEILRAEKLQAADASEATDDETAPALVNEE